MQFTAAILGFVLAFTGVSALPVEESSSLVARATYSGDGTYYATGLGSCGKTNRDSDYIVAISHGRMDSTYNANPNKNKQCGKKIRAHHKGKTITVTVVDRCEGCQYNDLDFSPAAYKGLGCTVFEGRCKITWEWA